MYIFKNEYKKKRYCSSVPAGDYVAAEFVNLLAIPLISEVLKRAKLKKLSGESRPPFRQRSESMTALAPGLAIRKDKKALTKPDSQSWYFKPQLTSGGEVGGLYPPDIYYYNR